MSDETAAASNEYVHYLLRVCPLSGVIRRKRIGRPFRLDDRGQIASKTKRNEQFCHHEGRPEQEVRRIVHQRRLPSLQPTWKMVLARLR